MKLFRRKFRVIVCLILGLPVLFLAEEHVRGRWTLSNWKQAMTAKGEKLSIQECRPVVPAGENGFPSLARSVGIGGDLSSLYPPSLKFAAPGRLISVRTLNDWPPASSAKQSGRGTTNVTWTELDLALTEWTNAFHETRSILEYPIFDSRLDYHAGFSIRLPHLAPFKRHTQQLTAASLNALHHGRHEEAVEYLESLLGLSRALQHERLIISQLVRQAMANIAVGGSWQALQYPGWNDAQLARLQHAWQLQEFVAAFGASLEMERAISIDSFAQMRSSGTKAMDQLGLWTGGPTPGATVNSPSELGDYLVENFGSIFFRTVYLPIWQLAWSHQDELRYLELVQPFIAASRTVVEQRSGLPAREAEQTARRQNSGSNDRVRFLVSNQILPTLENAITKAVNMEAQRELVVAAIALRRYELKHGRRAPELGALVPEFLPEPAWDYWAAAPLTYKPLGSDSFLLYSIGPNGTDDGGDAQPVQRNNSFSLTGGRDLVWPEAATGEEAIKVLTPRSFRPRGLPVQPASAPGSDPATNSATQ